MLRYKKMELLVSLRALDKANFIRINLKKISLAKEKFIMDIEHGSELRIP